jgi:AraC-like DNA-binding protein
MSKTCLLAPAAILWELLESYGKDPEPVFCQEGITREMVMQNNARVSQTVKDNLWLRVSQMIDDPCFGLRAGELWHPSHLNALGYAWLASATLREALDRLKRYLHIISKVAVLELQETPEGFAACLKFDPVAIYIPARTDQFFAILISMCRVNYGHTLNPVSVHFRREAPSCSGEFFSYFKSPVVFGAEKNCLILPADKMDTPLKGHNPEIARIHDQIIIRYLADMNKDDIVQRAKGAIVKLLPSGKISDDKVAGELFMSVRSMQRNLQKRDTTFGQLLDQVRQELAKEYVTDKNISLTEVAFVLGFSEQSVFSKAFKRWTGRTPSDVRKAA